MVLRKSYKVAGQVFSLSMDEGDSAWDNLGNYEPFLFEGDGEELFSLDLVPEFEFKDKKELYVSTPEPGEQRIDIYTIEGGYLLELAPLPTTPACAWLKVSGDFTKGCLKCVSSKSFCINNAMMLMFAFSSVGKSILEIHASCTIKDGKGFLFLGKSGTGKSTHSRLWIKNIPGAWLLNDDNPVIRVVDGVPRVYGTPWSGKTPCYINDDYPIGAVVRINQAPRNVIHKMGIMEGFASLYSSCSGLRAIKWVADGLFETVSTVVQKVPCYLMDCLPDDEAAIVCSKEVLGYE